MEKQTCDSWFSYVDHVVGQMDLEENLLKPQQTIPVIPSKTTLMISVIGADALGRVIADQCHRPLRVAVRLSANLTKVDSSFCSKGSSLARQPKRTPIIKSEMIIAVTKVSEENTKLVRELHEAVKEIDSQSTNWCIFFRRS